MNWVLSESGHSPSTGHLSLHLADEETDRTVVSGEAAGVTHRGGGYLVIFVVAQNFFKSLFRRDC